MAREGLLMLEGNIDEILRDGRLGAMLDTSTGSSPSQQTRCASIASAPSWVTVFTWRWLPTTCQRVVSCFVKGRRAKAAPLDATGFGGRSGAQLCSSTRQIAAS